MSKTIQEDSNQYFSGPTCKAVKPYIQNLA